MKIKVDDSEINVHFKKIDSEDISADMSTGSRSYRDLVDLPTLNGEPIIGDMHESDPTVPEWAKSETKPEYTAEEIGALSKNDEMSYADILEIWKQYFNE